jgi:hypothetical protein
VDPALVTGAGGALVVLIAWVASFIRGDVVPGPVYRREIARADKADDQAEQNAKALETVVRLLNDRHKDG